MWCGEKLPLDVYEDNVKNESNEHFEICIIVPLLDDAVTTSSLLLTLLPAYSK